jgi:hypothetical protein
MSDEAETDDVALESLARAVQDWVDQRRERALRRWLNHEVNSEGVPVRLRIARWPECLERLVEVERRGGEWPEGCEAQVRGLILASLRFTRPDGRPTMSFAGEECGASLAGTAADWADSHRGTGIARVLRWWFAPGRKEHAPPPIPAWSAPDRVLAALRPDWSAEGDFLAIDHRDPRSPCLFELFGAGHSWLGPQWNVDGVEALRSRPRPRVWLTGSLADLAEWSYRAGPVRVTQSAMLIRGRRLALLSALVEGRELSSAPGWAMRLGLPPGVAAAPVEGCRALSLSQSLHRGSAHVLPMGLPCRPYPTDRGRFLAEGPALMLNQAATGRRCWFPLLVSWEPGRHRKTLHWRILTVSERSRAVPPDRAFAARVSWGRDETYVIYRSLGTPATRAFLGYQTQARFLFGEFTTDGEVKPILTVE